MTFYLTTLWLSLLSKTASQALIPSESSGIRKHQQDSTLLLLDGNVKQQQNFISMEPFFSADALLSAVIVHQIP